ncbi:trichohyalin isoform X2 [Drosophila grimshawi]|uniref:GH19008 n=1 Tax=Drosophila grimshawi TaxID=7222 RepID=B4JHX6_DROGR|nr:trichohyalin isoform X2 [Drosophila grimshawi]EDV92884.1 GH19008 [Drosophila grimshawi]
MNESEENIIDVPAQQDISTRLAALNRWQEEQKRLLEERQNNQRLLLGLEQRNMYEMLGLLHKDLKTMDIRDMSDNDEQEQEEQQASSIEMPRHADHEQEQEQEENNNINEEGFQLTEIATGANGPRSVKPKRAFLRRGEGLKQRFKVDPDKLRLDNLPRYKFANAHPQLRTMPTPGKPPQKRSILKTHKEPRTTPAQPPQAQLSLKEQRFQQLLMNAKNVCSSTPDLKSSHASSSSNTNTNTSISPKVRFVEQNEKGQTADDEQSSTEASSTAALTNVCWAKVLNTQQIHPPVLHRRTAQICVENDENVSIFELLEQKAREGNIDMNSSCIRTFMARKEQRRHADAADDSDQIMVTQQLREMRLQPDVAEIIEEEHDAEDEVNSTLTLTPLRLGDGRTQVRVRFSDSNDTHEYSDETTLQDATNVQLFEEFKTALFQALEQRKLQHPTTTATATTTKTTISEEPLTQELQIQANLVRKRLQELETEIATFKEQNAQLLLLKQQHELDKANSAQEHQEAMDRVHDEKIKAEIYLHDERMKIEEERRKCEQQMRMQKSNINTKEKRELAALKQEVEALQQQLKQKEQTHVAAQARLRAQLRATEKEQRGYQDEIELLGRENKRLEQELVKLTRDSNSKMLQEINRNIARLAPKLEPAQKNTDENGKRQSKSIGDVLQEKATKQRSVASRRHSCNRSSRRKSQPPNESYASSSSGELDEVVIPSPPAAKKASPVPGTHGNSSNSEFKREIVNADGSKDIWYPNGNLKKISCDGMSVRMLYFNKDIKETDIRGGTVKYYYAETNTWHTTYLDGLEILEFPNGQTEHRKKDGTIEIHFPNNSIKIVDPSDAEKLEEWRYADGTHLVQLRSGDKILHMPNGQKEIHTKLNKRREYPDGTVKLVYPDGSQETRYSNGRVRLKDKDGKLIMDTDYAKY